MDRIYRIRQLKQRRVNFRLLCDGQSIVPTVLFPMCNFRCSRLVQLLHAYQLRNTPDSAAQISVGGIRLAIMGPEHVDLTVFTHDAVAACQFSIHRQFIVCFPLRSIHSHRLVKQSNDFFCHAILGIQSGMCLHTHVLLRRILKHKCSDC